MAAFDTDFPSWMLLALLHENRKPLPLTIVAEELERRMDLAAPETKHLVQRAAGLGWVECRFGDTEPAVELADTGARHFERVYAHARGMTDAVFDGIDAESVQAAVNVLVAVDRRAAALLEEA
ncbi:hypothetical protein [Nocardia blacklockiae]|uniref:hypothetical protein n=1 Tax=Nocardia blacklockiae TaxID=480036 RepID=UPI0018947B5B|nr:hypothetical protein [Nocardia blacklockiae]MBF6176380.1 hypothetical protein [Nocardia blacklockiae]